MIGSNGENMNWDPLYIVNLVLSVAIVVLGYLGYKKSKGKDLVPLCTGIGFGFFGISHLATILELTKDVFATVLIFIRVFGYLSVAYALNEYLKKR